MENCIFCSDAVRANAILETELAFVVYDKYPQAEGHVLIIPKAHSENIFEANMFEQIAIFTLVNKAKEYLAEKYKPSGYKIISNIGKAAGQEVFHTHIHLIPYYT